MRYIKWNENGLVRMHLKNSFAPMELGNWRRIQSQNSDRVRAGGEEKEIETGNSKGDGQKK